MDDAVDNSPAADTYVAYVRMLTASDDPAYAGLRSNSAPIIVADDDVAGVAARAATAPGRRRRTPSGLLAAPTAPVAVQLRSDADFDRGHPAKT
ncbi:MAG: hypothetical protein R2854_25570 [Caldilineaceae bacterium]